jgi:hypothetical protein
MRPLLGENLSKRLKQGYSEHEVFTVRESHRPLVVMRELYSPNELFQLSFLNLRHDIPRNQYDNN